ncbi:MAG: tetratricopeptide repeat protein [Polyangiaceae bacterium]|nr:tetratricopeptide repeat protein [Polyangiaceae bacterium]
MTRAKSSRRSDARGLAAALGALAVALAAEGQALAGDADGKTFFAEGRKLRADGHCDEAIPRFRLALEAWPEGLGALRNAAECEAELGRYASARRDYWDLRRAVLKSSNPSYAGWAEQAEAAYRRLEDEVARVTIELAGVDERGQPAAIPALDRLTVTLDGQPLNPKLLGTELERDLGTLVVTAAYGAATGVTRSVELGPGARERVRIELPMATDGPTEARHTPPPPEGGLAATQVGGIVALSLAGLAGGGALGALAVRQGALGSLEATCPAYRTATCSSSVEDDVSRGRTASTAINALLGVGAAAAAVGVILLVLPTGEPEPSASAALTLGPGGAGVRVRVGF